MIVVEGRNVRELTREGLAADSGRPVLNSVHKSFLGLKPLPSLEPESAFELISVSLPKIPSITQLLCTSLLDLPLLFAKAQTLIPATLVPFRLCSVHGKLKQSFSPQHDIHTAFDRISLLRDTLKLRL